MKEEATQMQMEWSKAQEVEISVNLAKAAKQQLRFLKAVDTNGTLYGGLALDRAIWRYKYCWLPLLAKHVNSSVTTKSLVVPLDCEWIWHCHRLNPVQYKADCERLFGKILGNLNVLSMTQVAFIEESETIWNKIYPTEPYDAPLDGDYDMSKFEAQRSISYDLKAAVKRQTPFSQRMAKEDSFDLEEAIPRYKAFLHLIKRMDEASYEFCCVPTTDIDFIWHTHQLHPISYSKDLKIIIGYIVGHNDLDTPNGETRKDGFIETTKVWGNTFGFQYLKGIIYHKQSVAHCNKDAAHCNKEAAHCNKDATHCNKEVAHCNKEATHCNKEAAHCNKEAAHCNKEAAHCNKEAAHCNKEAAHCNKEAVHCNKEAVHCNKDSTHCNKEAAHCNKEAAHCNKDATHCNKEVVHYNKAAAHCNKEAVSCY